MCTASHVFTNQCCVLLIPAVIDINQVVPGHGGEAAANGEGHEPGAVGISQAIPGSVIGGLAVQVSESDWAPEDTPRS